MVRTGILIIMVIFILKIMVRIGILIEIKDEDTIKIIMVKVEILMRIKDGMRMIIPIEIKNKMEIEILQIITT